MEVLPSWAQDGKERFLLARDERFGCKVRQAAGDWHRRCLGDYLGWRYKAQGQGAAGKRFISPEAGL